MVQYRDSYTWAKYCRQFIKLDFYGEGQINKNLHGTFRSRMIEFLQTDIDSHRRFDSSQQPLVLHRTFAQSVSSSPYQMNTPLPTYDKLFRFQNLLAKHQMQ